MAKIGDYEFDDSGENSPVIRKDVVMEGSYAFDNTDNRNNPCNGMDACE